MSGDVSDKIAAPNGGSRAMAVTSDHHTARLVLQNVSEPSPAEYSRLALGLPRHGTCERMPRFCAAAQPS